MPNVHSHAFQRAMAGLAERQGPTEDSFWTWREVMYRFLAQMTPDDIEAVAALAYVEMLEAGFTRVGEFHYLHNAPDGSRYADPAETAGRIAAAAATSGIGLTLLPCFYAHGGCGGKPPAPGQARFLSDLDGFARLMEASRTHIAALDGASLGIAPHSLRAVDAAELEALCRRSPPARSTSMPPSRRRRWRSASPGRARGPSNGCSTMLPSTSAGASSTAPT